MRSRKVALILFGLLLAVGSARSQNASGRIIGNVSDPSGAPILDAKVTVTNVATRVSEVTSSDKDGFYQVLSLPIGSYQVTVEKAGFRNQVFERQSLQINQSLRLDAKLVIGQRNEVVEVQDQAANVETTSETIGASITGETILRAPLDGRNVLDLALLQPGVTETNPDSFAAGSYSIAGGRSDSVTFLLDGNLNNNLLDNSVVYNPNPDTVAEFHILESNYGAEYGRNGGGIISVVTKSGTNQWHGSAFEFLRNDAFNANLFFNKNQTDPSLNLPRPVLKRNQYGATFGGPISLPKLVNGKDRFFFFVGYQGQRLSEQLTTGFGTVFTPAELNGDFSNGQAVGTCNNPNSVADPNVAAFLQANSFFQSDPNKAQCGIIDPTKINPISAKYVAAGLIPTNPSGVANYQLAHTNNNNELTAKLDFVITQNDKVSATFGGYRNPQILPIQYATVPGFPNYEQNNNYFTNAAYTHSFTANLVNEFRVFLQRSNFKNDAPARNLPTPAQFGIGITPDLPAGPTNLLFDNGLAIGFSVNGPKDLVDNTFGFTNTLSYIHGRNDWKMGGGVSAYQDNTIYDYYGDGEFDFNGSGGSGTGNALADFFLGIPSTFYQYPNALSNIRSKAFYGFLQDEWRVSKRFTLNLGLRYEYSSPKYDTKGRSFSVIPGLTIPSTVFTNAPIGMYFPGDAVAPKGTNFPDRKNFAPRFGFAWDVLGDGKTSVRGGFGIFYDILKGEDSLQFNGQVPFYGSVGLTFPSVTPTTCPAGAPPTCTVPYMSDPFGSTGTINSFPSITPPKDVNFANAGFLPINVGAIIYIVDPHLRTPYTYQYNLSVQREWFRNTVVEVSYVGSSSHGLTGLQDINPFVLGTTDRILNLTPGNSSCQDYDGNSSSGAGASAVCSFGGLPEFKNATRAGYNSLQASMTRQISDSHYLGKTYFTLAYTLAHSIDNVSGFANRNSNIPTYHPNQFRASSDQDIRNRITFSGGWDLPFDHMWSSGPKRLTQGWSLFPIFTWHDGFPFDIFARFSNRYTQNVEGPSGAGDPGNVHANIVGPTNALNPRASFANTGGTLVPCTPALAANVGCANYWINPNSFDSTLYPTDAQVVANPALATYGTLPRNYLRGPGYVNLDLAFSKTTALFGERAKLEFRGELFNIFNHANFVTPTVANGGANINSFFFGQLTQTADPRIIQLAARLSF